MAQRAFVSNYKAISGTANNGEMKITMNVQLLEESTEIPYEQEISIVTSWTDNNAAIKTKIVNAIVALAAANNYSTLTSANVILPSYTKG
jgi:hypothetical protein